MITTVVIPVLNRYDLLIRCLQSLPLHVRVLVIDNGDNRGDNLDREDLWPQMRVLRMPSNLGVPVSWNLGIKLYPHEPGWLLLNSDAWFDEGAWDVFEAECDESSITLAGAPAWCCAWIGRDVVHRVGLFCEAYYPAYMEDVDYEERARRAGLEIRYVATGVRHDNSSTINSDPELARRNNETHARNIQIHDARWNGLAAHEQPPVWDWSLRYRLANAWDA